MSGQPEALKCPKWKHRISSHLIYFAASTSEPSRAHMSQFLLHSRDLSIQFGFFCLFCYNLKLFFFLEFLSLLHSPPRSQPPPTSHLFRLLHYEKLYTDNSHGWNFTLNRSSVDRGTETQQQQQRNFQPSRAGLSTNFNAEIFPLCLAIVHTQIFWINIYFISILRHPIWIKCVSKSRRKKFLFLLSHSQNTENKSKFNTKNKSKTKDSCSVSGRRLSLSLFWIDCRRLPDTPKKKH